MYTVTEHLCKVSPAQKLIHLAANCSVHRVAEAIINPDLQQDVTPAGT